VAIVNRQFAEHFFKTVNVIGRHIGWGDGPKTKLNIEIVGVVENQLYEGPREGVRRQVFVPRTGNGGTVFYVRSSIGTSALYGQLRNEVRRIDNTMPVFGMKTLERQLDETLLTDRLVALLAAGFGILAAALASIGLYGVMAFVVARRRKELGIRLALGAPTSQVRRMVVAQGMSLAMVGVVIGLAAAFGLAKLITSFLFGVTAKDPVVFAGVPIVLALVALVAVWFPAHRASKVDPLIALRAE